MSISPTILDGPLVVSSPTFGDGRGFFRQTYQATELGERLGRPPTFAQGNHSRSAPGVLRGFHAEPWDKLIYVASGTVFAAVADIREDSATFGQVETFLLGDPPGERHRLFLTAGLANSFCVVGDRAADYLYDVSAPWTPDADKKAVAWDDPDLSVNWPVAAPTLSDADRANPTLRERFPHHPRFR